MWIVRLALRRPYTVAVMAFLILLLGALSIATMIVDIFPNVDIPVVAVVWSYDGLSAEDMERRVVLISERAYSSSVNGIQRIESESIPGIGLLKVYFYPGMDIGAAIAQISSVSSTILRIAPPGMQPPVIIQFNASNVPVAQLTVSSESIPEEKLFDYGLNFIRVQLFTIPGLSIPAPYGGKTRQIIVDVDPQALNARGLSPYDIVSALQAQNVIVPAGVARIGRTQYSVLLNSSPPDVPSFNSIPVKVVSGQPVLLGDVGRVWDAYADQTNIVRVNGRRATYLAILKHSDASTLTVVNAVRAALPQIKAAAPKGLELKIDFDQSLFVRAAISGVLREGLIASGLVSLMILVFLGSWRSTIIVCTSIPLAIFAAIIGLKLSGQSINLMTLGGLSLAIGMLVDDATVEVENIHRNLGQDKPLTVAILDGARQIAVPAIVATLSICIVFFPVVLLVGPARYLFTPLALSVVFSMLVSYLLSRTLVPALFRKLMRSQHQGHNKPHDQDEHKEQDQPKDEKSPPKDEHKPQAEEHPHGLAARYNAWRDKAFDRLRDSYGRVLDVALEHRAAVLILAGGLLLVSSRLLFVIGTDFFPTPDAGLMKLHFRAPTGSRIEETERLIKGVENRIRQVIPKDELSTLNDMIGVPTSYNLAFVQTDNASTMDADILVALNKKHHPTERYMRELRRELPAEFPGSVFYFQPADIVNQVLNFGLSAPIDVQIQHPDLSRAAEVAHRLRDAISTVPGAADVHVLQVVDYPAIKVDVDRIRAAQLGVTQRDVANSLLVSLSSSSLVSPSYFLNPQNNVNYVVAVKSPMRLMDSIPSMLRMPIMATAGTASTPQAQAQQPMTAANGSGGRGSWTLPTTAPTDLPTAPAQVLGNLAQAHPEATPNEISHYTVQRIVDVGASTDGRDLGGVVKDIQRKIAELGKLPDGMKIDVRGQFETMTQSFKLLGLGLILSILLVYALMVVLFQSYLDPFIILFAVPGALVGILWMLALTGTTLNVESLMGSIMSVGIAVSNSILLVSFANEARAEKEDLSAVEAARQAGRTRLRPVIMTALAMILGMVPMALGLGEGGEQNAPLGRAVIGGLLVATFMTLFVVPVIYSLLRRGLPTLHVMEKNFEAEERGEDSQDQKPKPEQQQPKQQQPEPQQQEPGQEQPAPQPQQEKRSWRP